MRKKLIACLVAASFAGCATTGSTTRTLIYPVIDMAMNPKERDYHADINQCNAYTSRVSPGQSAATSALAGGAIGSVLGVIIGAALGVNFGQTAAIGAGTMGGAAAVEGGMSAARSKHTIVAKCMTGRGYTVLQP
jgi:uncharacterized protein YcfJ